MSDVTINYQVALSEIHELLGMPRGSSPYSIVCEVRETKASADLAGAALEAKTQGCAACDRGDYQLSHADHCLGAAQLGDLPIGPRRLNDGDGVPLPSPADH